MNIDNLEELQKFALKQAVTISELQAKLTDEQEKSIYYLSLWDKETRGNNLPELAKEWPYGTFVKYCRTVWKVVGWQYELILWNIKDHSVIVLSLSESKNIEKVPEDEWPKADYNTQEAAK